MSRPARLSLLAVLYTSQFLGVGFIYYAVVAVLREAEVPLAQIGLVQSVIVLWLAKFLWAPAVDRWATRWRAGYRGVLLVLQPLLAGCVLCLGLLDPVADLPALIAVTAAIALVSSTQDIAVDALAVRLLRAAERGPGNGIQVAGAFLGTIVGGAAVLVVIDTAGWWPAVLVLAALTCVPVPFLVRFREPDQDVAAPDRVGWTTWIRFFRRPGHVRWALMALPLLTTGAGVAAAVLTPLLVDAGWSLSRIATVSVLGGGSAGVVAALGAGRLIRRVGVGRAVFAAGGLLLLGLLLMLPVATGIGGTAVIVLAVVAVPVASASVTTLVYTAAMERSRPSRAGSDFTIQACLVLLFTEGIGAVGVGLAGPLGYGTVIAAAAVTGLLGTVVTARVLGRLRTADAAPLAVAASAPVA
jgi:hypothetical protein